METSCFGMFLPRVYSARDERIRMSPESEGSQHGGRWLATSRRYPQLRVWMIVFPGVVGFGSEAPIEHCTFVQYN